jgi:hypothetical protein
MKRTKNVQLYPDGKGIWCQHKGYHVEKCEECLRKWNDLETTILEINWNGVACAIHNYPHEGAIGTLKLETGLILEVFVYRPIIFMASA